MPYETKTYDDDVALTEYVWTHYMPLMHVGELRANAALIGQAKCETAGPKLTEWIRARWGSVEDPDVGKMLADGEPAFRRRVRDRILRECAPKVFINRCPNCICIVRTPLAQQCLWCGYDWHSRENRMMR